MANNCQVPTPKKYVLEMLDYIGYTEQLYGKSVLENSCGDGNILVEIVRRYILDSKQQGYSNAQIIEGLSRDICAYEIDKECIKKCKSRLNALIYRYGLKGVKWNILNKDFLKDNCQTYQYVIGNPPYITYHDLPEEQRIFLKENFVTCQEGRFDYSYAFIEASLKCLMPEGRMIYLVPYSIMTNKFAEQLRENLASYLKTIYDYRTIKVFPEATTSAIMILCQNIKNVGDLNYYIVASGEKSEISRQQFIEKSFWDETLATIQGKRFGDYFEVSNSVATLYNDAFLLREYKKEGNYYCIGKYKIEDTLVREAVSTKSFNKRKTKKQIDMIIFPYKYENGKTTRYSKEEFNTLFPKCCEYMLQYKIGLKDRKADEKAEWFEYGRSQAISKVYGEKLIIPMVITNSVTVYKASEKSIPYAGYFIKRKEGSSFPLEKAKEILESQEFYKYVEKNGTPTTPTSYRISVNDIKDFLFH